MSLIARKEVKYSLGLVGVGVLIYGMFKLYKLISKKPPKTPTDNEETRSQGK